MNKIILISAITLSAIALVVGIIAITKPNTTTVIGPNGERTEVPFGALSSTLFPVDYYGVGGVVEYKESAGLLQGTTTICALKSPAATSTLMFASLNLTTATTAEYRVEVGKHSTAYGTTTAFITAQDYDDNEVPVLLVASTTLVSNTGILNDAVFAPSTYLNFIMGSTTLGYDNVTVNPVGKCQAIWLTIE